MPQEPNGRFFKAELVVPNISNEYKASGSLLRLEEQSPNSDAESDQYT